MSTTTIVAFKAKAAKASGPPNPEERRSKRRYPLHLGVRFRFRMGDLEISGEGRTVNVSAAGLLVASRHIASRDEVCTGARVQLIIDWPVLLDGKIALQFHAAGRVVRKGSEDFAATFLRHEFRTVRQVGLRAVHSGAEVVPRPLLNV
jgi:hypothetical protein